jgi:hypothetical protein
MSKAESGHSRGTGTETEAVEQITKAVIAARPTRKERVSITIKSEASATRRRCPTAVRLDASTCSEVRSSRSQTDTRLDRRSVSRP